MTTWSIGEAAEKCGLSQHTLRWYERIGLLGPVARDANGRRRFSDGDLDWLDLITRLRETGMPVSDMQRYAELVRSGAGEAERSGSNFSGVTATKCAGPWPPSGNASSCSTRRSTPTRAGSAKRGPADADSATRRAEMRTTKLGDLTVSAQGLGCMGMSEWYGAADWDESIATIHAALDAGVTFLDTADA